MPETSVPCLGSWSDSSRGWPPISFCFDMSKEFANKKCAEPVNVRELMKTLNVVKQRTAAKDCRQEWRGNVAAADALFKIFNMGRLSK